MRLGKQMIVSAVACAMLAGPWMRPRASVLAQPVPAANPANLSPDEKEANQALAERIAQAAQMLLNSSSMSDPVLRQAASMFEAANRLAPQEPRFLRLLTECYLQIGGDEGRAGALSSLTRYRQLAPADFGAQIQIIDLYYSQQETADARKKYVDDLLQAPSLDPQVRSHVAVLGARLGVERASTAEARLYTQAALKYMPLSPDALGLQWQLLGDDATDTQRVAVLVQMLLSNPAQPWVMNELASELADAGAVDASMVWYQNLLTLYSRLGVAPPLDQFGGYATELVISDQLAAASNGAQQLLSRDPSDVSAAFVLLIAEKRGGNAEKITAAADKTRTALLLRLDRISAELNGRQPTTLPSAPAAAALTPAPDAGAAGALPPPALGADAAAVTAPKVDIDSDIKKLVDQKDTNVAAAYGSVLGDLAWLEIYFNRKPADAQQYLTALRQIVPADNAVLTRLDGWGFLVDDKKPEAAQKLSAVADRDPFAALGMLLMSTEPPAQQTLAARKLLNDNASGLIGAILIEALRDKVGLMPAGPEAAGMRNELAKIPVEWLDLLDIGKASNFYVLKGQVNKVANAFGDPILATITIQNKSSYPLTIGDNGVIHPNLWIDAQLRGLMQDYVAGVAIERISQRRVLQPKEIINLLVRLDQGALSQKLASNPIISIPIFFNVQTNPMTQANGVVPGPCGYRSVFPAAERAATKMDAQTIQGLMAQMQNASGGTKVRLLDHLAALSRLMQQQQQNPQLQGMARQLSEFARNSIGDRVSGVRAEALFVSAMLADETVRGGLIRQMLSDNDLTARTMGLIAVGFSVDPDKRKGFLEPVQAGDSDPLLQRMAGAMIEVAAIAPTTQSSTQPSTAPSANDVIGAVGVPDFAAPSGNK
jgi:hypothetical protein